MHSSQNNPTIGFKDYFSYAELAQDAAILQKLIRCYRTIFSEDDTWCEDYSEQEIHQKLRDELCGNCALRLCLTQLDVVGFCWVQHLDANAIYQHIGAIKYFQHHDTQEFDLRNVLKNKIDHSATYIHDLGIAKAYRSTIALDQLIVPVLQYSFEQSNSRTLAFWSLEETCISHLAQKAYLTPFLKLKNMVFFCDDVKEAFIPRLTA